MHTSENKRKKKKINNILKIKTIKKNNTSTLPPYVSSFANKDIHHDIYYINYNKIAGLETYPGKFNIQMTENSKLFPTLKKKHNNFLTLNDNKKLNPGYMTIQEIFDEIISLSNKHKINDEGSEELLKVGKEVNEIAFGLKNKLREPGAPIYLGTFIFRQPFDKKNKNKTLNKRLKNMMIE